MRKLSSTTRLSWMLLLSYTIDLTINHAVMSVTLLQIHANEAMIRKGVSVKDPVQRTDSTENWQLHFVSLL